MVCVGINQLDESSAANVAPNLKNESVTSGPSGCGSAAKTSASKARASGISTNTFSSCNQCKAGEKALNSRSMAPARCFSKNQLIYRNFLHAAVSGRQCFFCDQAESFAARKSLQCDEISLGLDSLSKLLFQFCKPDPRFELNAREKVSTSAV